MYKNLKQIVRIALFTVFMIVIVFYLYNVAKPKVNDVNNGKRVLVSGNAIMEVENCKDPSAEPVLKPYDSTSIAVREGELNDFDKPIIDSVLTNREGMFSLRLAPGKYCAIFKDKVAKGELSSEPVEMITPTGEFTVGSLDVSCYTDYLSKCDAILDVPNDGLSNVVMTYVAKCEKTCVNYE